MHYGGENAAEMNGLIAVARRYPNRTRAQRLTLHANVRRLKKTVNRQHRIPIYIYIDILGSRHTKMHQKEKRLRAACQSVL